MHWAAVNSQLAIIEKLVEFPAGPGIDLIDIKNSAGRSPLGEAEFAGWEEGAKWLVQMMRVAEHVDLKHEEGEQADDEFKTVHSGLGNIQVEIEDAEGQVAKLMIKEQ